MNNKKTIQLCISIIGGLLIATHMIWPELKVDSITVILFAIIIIPWLAPVFKSLEFPGGVKLEYNLEKLTQKLEDSGLIRPEDLKEAKTTHHKYSFMNVVDLDSGLALAGLRMEIESRLQKLAEYSLDQGDVKGIGGLTRNLEQNRILTKNETSAIKDVLPILNNAAHGREVDRELHNWAMEIGPQLLDGLESKIAAQELPSLIRTFANRDGALGHEVGYELSKKLIQSTKSFFAQMSRDKDVFHGWLNELGGSTFTIFESKDEIDELLNYSKYARLKEMMIESVQEYLENENDDLAHKTLDELNRMNIRSVW